jgi:hypothetical protein
MMQSFPFTDGVELPVYAAVQSALVSAFASGGETTEIAERVETAITKAKKWWSARRATRLKVAILAAKCISTSTLLI